jgi:hypothetical protein
MIVPLAAVGAEVADSTGAHGGSVSVVTRVCWYQKRCGTYLPRQALESRRSIPSTDFAEVSGPQALCGGALISRQSGLDIRGMESIFDCVSEEQNCSNNAGSDMSHGLDLEHDDASKRGTT